MTASKHQNPDQDNLIQEIRDSVDGLLAIYLFGSAEKGTMHIDSDIDIAVQTAGTNDPVKLWHTSNRLAKILKKNVDLVDLNVASTVMKMQIISTGRRIYSIDATNSEQFEDYVYSSYARLNEERADILSDISKRKTIYG